jgi:WD40 repeat protein
MPRLLDVWFLPDLANPGRAASADGRRFLAVNKTGLARVQDADTRQPLSPPLEQAGFARFAAFSPDGERVLTADAGHQARVWEARTGRPVTPAFTLDGPLAHAVLTADGRRVVTLGQDGRARLLDGETGRMLPGLEKHPGTIRHVDFSPDGQAVVTAGDDRTTRIWSSATGRPGHVLAHPHPVWHASFSPDGKQLVTACSEWPRGGETLVWSVEDGRLLERVPEPQSSRAFFSPDGRQAFTVAGSRVRFGGPGRNQPLELPHQSFVHLVAFAPDSSRVHTTARDLTARLWDLPSGWPRTPPVRHGAAIWHLGVSQDGRRWRTASHDGLVRTWSLGGGPDRTMTHERVWRMALSPDGRWAATAGRDGKVRVWELDSGRELARLDHPADVYSVACSPDGELLATTCGDDTLRIWAPTTGKSLAAPLPILTTGQVGGIGSQVAFSRDSRFLLTGGGTPKGQPGRGEARVHEARTGRLVASLPHATPVWHAAFSPDRRRVVTGSVDGALVWDLEQRAVVLELGRDKQGVYQVSYSPDGSRILTANAAGVVQIHDAATGQPLTRMPSIGFLWAAPFSPDGQRILTAGEDFTARVQDAATGKPVTAPLRHRSRVADAHFSADGRYVVTSSQEGERIQDAATGRLLTVPFLPARGTGWGKAALTSDNRRLVSADLDELVRVWDDVLDAGDESIADLVLQARLVAGQRMDANGGLVPLTPEEVRDGWADLHSGGKDKDRDESRSR